MVRKDDLACKKYFGRKNKTLLIHYYITMYCTAGVGHYYNDWYRNFFSSGGAVYYCAKYFENAGVSSIHLKQKLISLSVSTKAGFEINACPKQAEIASGKLFFAFTCPTAKLIKCSLLSKDYLERQIVAFSTIKQNAGEERFS